MVDNCFFRGKKFRSVGYVIGKLMLWKKDSRFRFDHTITMEDFRNTAENLLRFGSVVINNYVFPSAKHYQSGGMGTWKERVPFRMQDIKRLLFLYKGLFLPKDRKMVDPETKEEVLLSNYDLRMRLTNSKQISAWRKETYERWKSLASRNSD